MIFLILLPLVCSSAEQPNEEQKPRQIPIAVQMEFFRADGAAAHAQLALGEAEADLQKAIRAAIAACGSEAAPTLVNKQLICVPTKEAKK
jgi:hypothetical protein